MSEDNTPEMLPRFSFQVPADLTAEFVKEMKREFRETPSALVTAIVRKYFANRAHAEVVQTMRSTESPEDVPQVPTYGARPAKIETESVEQRK